MESSFLKVVVKTPNQEIDDQVVYCEGSWTIKQLKGHLTEIFPSKPKSEEQKLIYSGQLLNDHLILKDVLNEHHTDVHTVHLVCPSLPKVLPPETILKPMQAKEERDQQHSVHVDSGSRNGVAENTNKLQFSQQQQQMYQQMMLMYSQYMMQYMDYLQHNSMIKNHGDVSTEEINPSVSSTSIDQRPQVLHGAEQQPIINPQIVQPAFRADDDDDGHQNHNWIDWMHLIFQFLLFLSLIYYYSSAMRMFLVMSTGIIVYMYQLHRNMQRRHSFQTQTHEQPPSQTDSTENVVNEIEREPARTSIFCTAVAFLQSLLFSIIPELPTN